MFEEGTAERNLFLEQNQNVFIFSAYTDACSSSWKIVVASKRPLITVVLSTMAFLHRFEAKGDWFCYYLLFINFILR